MVIGHWEVHAFANTGSFITGSETFMIGPSNVFAWTAMCETTCTAEDGWQAMAGIQQVKHAEGVDNFPFESWALSVFRTGVTSVTFGINALVLGDGSIHTRARWAMQFWD